MNKTLDKMLPVTNASTELVAADIHTSTNDEKSESNKAQSRANVSYDGSVCDDVLAGEPDYMSICDLMTMNNDTFDSIYNELSQCLSSTTEISGVGVPAKNQPTTKSLVDNEVVNLGYNSVNSDNVSLDDGVLAEACLDLSDGCLAELMSSDSQELGGYQTSFDWDTAWGDIM